MANTNKLTVEYYYHEKRIRPWRLQSPESSLSYDDHSLSVDDNQKALTVSEILAFEYLFGKSDQKWKFSLKIAK